MSVEIFDAISGLERDGPQPPLGRRNGGAWSW